MLEKPISSAWQQQSPDLYSLAHLFSVGQSIVRSWLSMAIYCIGKQSIPFTVYKTMLQDEHLKKSDKVLLLDTFKTYLTTALEDHRQFCARTD